jgi:hypothetical protein
MEPSSRRIAKVAVVVGHNRVARGSRSGNPLLRSEYEFNSHVAALMRQEAARYDLQLEVFLREPNASADAEIRIVYAGVAAWQATCVLELHFNSVDNPAATGSEVLFRGDSDDAKSLAASVIRSLQRTLDLRLRHGNGLKALSAQDRGWSSVAALPGIPIVLCEPFFGSSPADCSRVGTVGEEALARAYLRAAQEWLMARTLIS